MNYICGNYVFETEIEANKFRNWNIMRTGEVLGVFRTMRKVTHIFNMKSYTAEEKKGWFKR
jgi:hypothetical protein